MPLINNIAVISYKNLPSAPKKQNRTGFMKAFMEQCPTMHGKLISADQLTSYRNAASKYLRGRYEITCLDLTKVKSLRKYRFIKLR